MPSPTSASTATTPKSKSSKSPRPDSSVEFAAKPACAHAFVRAVRDPSALAVLVAVRSDRVPMPLEPSGRELPEAESEPRRDREKSGPRRQPEGTVKAAPRSAKSPSKEDTMAEGISLAEQGSIAKEFLEGLLASMNIQAEITVKELDEETVEAFGQRRSTDGTGCPRGTAWHHAAGTAGSDAYGRAGKEPKSDRPDPGRRRSVP